MKHLTAALMLCLAATALGADKLPKPPATAPASQPTAEVRQRIAQLIAQLGDSAYRIREAASDELRKLGTAAAPQLAEARKCPDPEIAARAQAILDEIEAAARPKTAVADNPNGFQVQGNGIMIQGRIQVIVGGAGQGNVRREAQSTEDGKTIKVSEDAQGIIVSITQSKDGKDATEEFKAKTAEELKKNHPEAHKYYEKLLGNQKAGHGVQIRIGGQ